MKSGVSPSRLVLIVATGIMILLGNMVAVEAQTNVVAAVSAASTAQAAPTQSAPTHDSVVPNMLSNLNVWVTIIGVLVGILSLLCTILLVYAVGTSLLHYRQAAKEVEEGKLLIKQMLDEFEEAHDIAKLKTPDQISSDILDKIQPRFDALQKGLEHHDKLFDSRIDVTENAIQSLKDQLGRRPTIEQVIVEMDKKYRPPQDLQEKLLGQVLDAFLQMKKLEREEVEAIRRILRGDGKVVGPPNDFRGTGDNS